MKNIVICGYHGYENFGDEVILQAMLDIIKEKCVDVHITIISGRPQKTMELYGVDSVYRYDLVKINRLFKTTDLFVFGGGGLIQDITSSRSLYYYLTVLKIAQLHKVKVMLYGNGIGPLRHNINRKNTQKCLNNVQIITVRDNASAELLKEIGVYKPKIIVTADPVFALKQSKNIDFDNLLSEVGLQKDSHYAIISIRYWKKIDPLFSEKIAFMCDELNEKYGLIPLFIPMQYEVDSIISKKVIAKMKTKGYVYARALEMDEILSLIGGATIVVGMRLHSLICATLQGIPNIALSYDPKVSGFMQSIKQPFYIDVEEVDENKLKDMIALLMNSLPSKRMELDAQVEQLKKEAEKNADLVVELLKEKKKILHISRTMGQGGAEKVVYQLCHDNHMHKQHVASCGGQYVDELNVCGVEHFNIPDIDRKNPFLMLKTFFTLFNVVKKEKIDIVHSHHRMGAFYARCLKILSPTIKHVYTAHNVFHDKIKLSRFSLEGACIVAVGDGVKQNLVEEYEIEESRINIIHNAIHVDVREKYENEILAFEKDKGSFLIGNIGRISKQKGIDIFLKAMEKVIFSVENAVAVIVGAGEDMDNMKLLAEELGIAENVIFLGYQNKVLNIIQQLDFVVLSSRWEGLPLTPIEVFSQKKTIIASNISGNNEIVQDEKNGLLFEVENADELAQKILWLMENVDERIKFENQAFKTYEEEFCYETFINKYNEIY